MDGSSLWSHSFISHNGIILTIWNSTLENRAAMMASHIHWSSELQARLPPSCHLCLAAPLQGSRKGLSNPASDARHFPDTLRSWRYTHMLNQIHQKTLPVPYWTILSPRPSLVSSKSMTSHLEHSYLSFRWRSQDCEKNPTSLTGLVPLAASRQLSSLIILRKKSDIQ